MSSSHILQLLVPPALWQMGSAIKRRLMPSTTLFQYAPQGWQTPLPHQTGNDEFWSAFIAQELTNVQRLISQVRAGTPALGNATGEQSKYAVFGYVLALATRNQRSLSVLDYGGNMGDYYWLARALVPGVELDYHCKDLPAIVDAARPLTPDIKWHTDDDCLGGRYQLVMFSSSLQYLPDWAVILRRAAHAAEKYLLLTDVPTVRARPSYIATHRVGGHTCLQIQLNRADVIAMVEAAGLRLIREFEMGPHPPIVDAPERADCVAWLFERA